MRRGEGKMDFFMKRSRFPLCIEITPGNKKKILKEGRLLEFYAYCHSDSCRNGIYHRAGATLGRKGSSVTDKVACI